ncbi:Dopa decarboxylase [Carabus blaptoides fortunei]
MDSEQFREFAKASADYIANYLDNIRDKPVLPDVQPGYLQALIPSETPYQGESWQEILKDMDRVIMPGVTHWHSPQFHAYYPTANSYPAIVGEMMSAGIACIGFSWISGPACTELEVVMMDWMGKLLGLPEQFLNCSEGHGGGVLQGSASEATLVGLLAAKERKVKHYKRSHPDMDDGAIKAKLIAYTSDQSNSSVEKAGLLGSMPMRLLPSDEDGCLRGETLKEAIEKDKANGLIPCYVVATLGTTGTCAFDNLQEIGPICNAEDMWLHIDAAYAGAAFSCPEYRHLMKGVEFADSFNFNPHKWMLVNFDCSALWVKNAKYLVEAFNVDRIYLQHQHEGQAPDYRHWQIPLGRRFRSLKVWFVLRSYGVEGIRHFIRNHISQAEYFANLVTNDSRFEVTTKSLGLVCFRVKGEDAKTKSLLDKLQARKNIYLIPATYRGHLIIRFVVCSRHSEKRDIEFAWREISSLTDEIFAEETANDTKIISTLMNEKCNINKITPAYDAKRLETSTEKSK